jgi:hypothetical protein
MKTPVALMVLGALLAGCGPEDVGALALATTSENPGDVGGDDPPPDEGSPGQVCKRVTVSGSVYYNEQRTYGRFSLRYRRGAKVVGPYGAILFNPTQTGTQYKLAPDPGLNYLGLYDATVEIVEVDVGAKSHFPGCSLSVMYGSTTVDEFGDYTWTGDVCDSCDADGAEAIDVAVRVKLKSCPDADGRCFEVKDPGPWCSGCSLNNETAAGTYERYYPSADLTNPRRVVNGPAVFDLADMYYEDVAGTYSDVVAQAANVFSEMVDVTRFVHVKAGIPAYQAQYGSVDVIYPSNWDSALGHSHESSKLCLRASHTDGVVTPTIECSSVDPATGMAVCTRGWYRGTIVMHEYGHIVNYRAWDGHGKSVSYCFNNWPACEELWHTAEYTSAAFKEGWAEFVWHAALEGHNSASETDDPWGCGAAAYDTMATDVCPGPEACGDGHRVIENVSHALCDWYDEVDDNNPQFCQSTDHLDAGMYAIWAEMKGMWDVGSVSERDAYDGTAKDDGLDLCEMAEHFLDETIGAHTTETDNLFDVLENNGTDCGLRLTPKICN